MGLENLDGLNGPDFDYTECKVKIVCNSSMDEFWLEIDGIRYEFEELSDKDVMDFAGQHESLAERIVNNEASDRMEERFEERVGKFVNDVKEKHDLSDTNTVVDFSNCSRISDRLGDDVEQGEMGNSVEEDGDQ